MRKDDIPTLENGRVAAVLFRQQRTESVDAGEMTRDDKAWAYVCLSLQELIMAATGVREYCDRLAAAELPELPAALDIWRNNVTTCVDSVVSRITAHAIAQLMHARENEKADALHADFRRRQDEQEEAAKRRASLK